MLMVETESPIRKRAIKNSGVSAKKPSRRKPTTPERYMAWK